jgi:DNA invertase Pin-like site-specific DNA recombinase
MTVRTALYLRVSSREQAKEGISIPDQLERLRAEARAAGETVVAVFVDQARSGTKAINRPEYQSLLRAARQHDFDRVRVESVDRSSKRLSTASSIVVFAVLLPSSSLTRRASAHISGTFIEPGVVNGVVATSPMG